ncbi:hypothetical protein GCM10027048_26780 [Hymenobacter coalescens]
MRLFTFWVRRTQNHYAPGGRLYHLIAYAGSDTSLADAQRAADEQLRGRIMRLDCGQRLNNYPIGTAPLREAVEQRLFGADGQLTGAVTRNRYGSPVLNTTRMMMLDVDLDNLRPQWLPRPPKSPWQRLQELFRGRPRVPAAPIPEPRAVLDAKLQQWLEQHPNWNFRLYGTRLGFRLLVTHALFDPNGPEADAVFRQLPVDPIYARLCRSQACYRARLGPKPWRIGLKRPAQVFPFETEAEAAAQARWEQQYADRSRQYAVCELLGSFGSGYVCPEAEPLLALHDAACLGLRRLA